MTAFLLVRLVALVTDWSKAQHTCIVTLTHHGLERVVIGSACDAVVSVGDDAIDQLPLGFGLCTRLRVDRPVLAGRAKRVPAARSHVIVCGLELG